MEILEFVFACVVQIFKLVTYLFFSAGTWLVDYSNIELKAKLVFKQRIYFSEKIHRKKIGIKNANTDQKYWSKINIQ